MARAIIYYATKYGSTQEIAEALGEKLGIPSKNVMYVTDGSELDQYDVIILGSPIYYDDICENMKHFLTSFFIKIGGKKLITYAVYGATKGHLDRNYAQTFADYFSPAPQIALMFLGRATKESLSKDDYRKLEIFYKNRLNAELTDFDYFDENKLDIAAEKIKEIIG
jgi:menaquinone-dependent protoporphyrinogen IX oxidase